MKIFLKKFNAFAPEKWPVIGFDTKGGRDKLIEESGPNDLVVFLGTKELETSPEDQGRLLGIAKFERLPTITLDHVQKQDMTYEKGEPKWPYCVLLTKAWFFCETVDVRKILKPEAEDTLKPEEWARFEGVKTCHPVSDESVEKILSLHKKDVLVGSFPT